MNGCGGDTLYRCRSLNSGVLGETLSEDIEESAGLRPWVSTIIMVEDQENMGEIRVLKITMKTMKLEFLRAVVLSFLIAMGVIALAEAGLVEKPRQDISIENRHFALYF